MHDRVFLVHGWSVESTTTYRGLDKALAAHGFLTQDIMLGRYVSLDDHLTIGDLANGLEQALQDLRPKGNAEYHFITHSTGALIVRDWLRRHYRSRSSGPKLGNVVMLAGPQYGSRLAHLGRSLLAKLKWFGGTGDEILHGLELGSRLQWDLADDLLDRGPIGSKGDARLFAITGDSFRTDKLASRVVPASAETGSDGTVRTAAANLNLTRYKVNLAPTYHHDTASKTDRVTWSLTLDTPQSAAPSPFLVLPSFYHTDDRKRSNRGILRSIKENATVESSEPLAAIVECLGIGSATAYESLIRSYKKRTESHFRPSGWNYLSAAAKKADKNKNGDPGDRNRKPFTQLQFRFTTDAGEPVTDFRFEMIAIKNGETLNTKTISHVHVNRRHKNHITFFLDHRYFEPDLRYRFFLAVKHPTTLLHDVEASITLKASELKNLVTQNRTTQIDVVVERAPLVSHRPDLPGAIGFFASDSPARHVKFDRHGRAKKKGTGLSQDRGLD